MGIRGLLRFIKNDIKSYRKSIVIEDLGTDESNIEILVHFKNFQRHLVAMITNQLARKFDNNYLLFPSGEYDILQKAFSQFHTVFKKAGINLVWMIEDLKGIDKDAMVRGNTARITRDKEDIKHLNEVLDSAEDGTYSDKLEILGPKFRFSKCIKGLKAAGAEVITSLQEDVCGCIAHEYYKRKSFAIISNDTNYLVFPGVKVIFPDIMSLEYGEDNMNLPFIDNNTSSENIFTEFKNFQCPIVEQKGVCQILQLSCPSQMITFSIIMGNGEFKDYVLALRETLQINSTETIIKVARFILEHEVNGSNVWKIPEMKAFLKENPKILKSINSSYKYYAPQYSPVKVDPISTDCSTLTGFLRMKLSKFEINSAVYSIHLGSFTETILPERDNPWYPSIATIMADIRAELYPYLLDESLNEVLEWRPRSRVREYWIPVEHSEFKTNEIKGKPDPGTERSGPIIYGIDLFEKVWSHLERKGSLEYFTKFGLKKGFICYILRYLYQKKNYKNLNISEDEFRALFITVFYQHGISEGKIFDTKIERDEFLKLKICPTERCLIIFSWFMNVYYTGKYLSGGAFNLTADLPEEENVINGSSFYAFYESIKNVRNSHLDSSIRDSIKTLGEEIMEQYHEEYALVTK